MNLLFLDYETFWSQTHDIKKCGGQIRYVKHPETEIISCAFKDGFDGETFVLFGDEIKHYQDQVDWDNTMAIGHNMSGFDSLILAWRYGKRPKAWGCTLAMSRPYFSKTVGNSLKAVSKELGLGDKLSLEGTNTKGKHLSDFTPEEIEAMREYNKVDTDLCAGIFKALAPKIGRKELMTIDYTIRMTTEPKFVLDAGLVKNTLIAVDAEKAAVLDQIADQFSITEQDSSKRQEEVRKLLASAPKFAKILEEHGVEVPMKISKTTGKETFALSKTDQGLLDLQEHPDERVQALVSARLSVKSTILQTRLQAFLDNRVGGRLPMPLAWSGADTTGRWSGQLYNPQNLPRINPDKPKHSDALRKSLGVRDGYKVVVADASGIELRVNHFLWQVDESMDLYKASPDKADLYKAFASALYGVEVSEVDKQMRQTGKIAQLGLGFGAGAVTFQRIAKLQAGLDMPIEEAKRVVDMWRKTYKKIDEGWKKCQASIPSMVAEGGVVIDPWGLCVTEKGGVRLPSGRQIIYPNLRKSQDDKGKSQWYYGEGRHKASLYSGKFDENLVQAIARDIVNDNAHEYHKRTGRWPCLCVHDELVYVVKEEDAQQALDDLQEVMRTPPAWWPELIVWSEGDLADTYGDAK